MARKILLVAGALTLVAPAAPALAATYTPDCVKPGARLNVASTFQSTPGIVITSAATVSTPEVWKGDDGVVSTETATEGPRGPVSNAPDPNFATYYVPSFAQTIAMPPAKAIGGLPVTGYEMAIKAYGNDGTEYSTGDVTPGWIFPDIKAVYLAQRSVKASRNQRVAYLVRGFRTARTYAHVSGPGATKHIRLSRASGRDTCGRAFGLMGLSGLKPGSYTVRVNTSRKGTSGGVTAPLKISR